MYSRFATPSSPSSVVYTHNHRLDITFPCGTRVWQVRQAVGIQRLHPLFAKTFTGGSFNGSSHHQYHESGSFLQGVSIGGAQALLPISIFFGFVGAVPEGQEGNRGRSLRAPVACTKNTHYFP